MSAVQYDLAGDAEDTVRTPEASPMPSWLPWAIAGVAVILLAALAAWVVMGAGNPGENSAEAGFARDMMEHHDQAVEMSAIILQRSDDELLGFLATDIMLTQQAQLGQMRGWLDAWGLHPVNAGPAMVWMDHPTTGRMPGMASPEDIQRMKEIPVNEAEGLFLELMIIHHVAGVEMADAALERTDHEAVVPLARSMSEAQMIEIDLMQDMLVERGFEPVPIEPQIMGGDHSHH